MTRASLMLLSVSCAYAACVPVEGDRLTGADLARALPAFAAIPRDASFGFTPSPGVKRVFSTLEIMRIAGSYGIDAPFLTPVCFEYATEPVTAERFLSALRETLPDPGVSIEILDYSRAPLPAGRFTFPRSGLMGPDHANLWRGRVEYRPARSLPVWVKVRLSVERTVVAAGEMLTPGKPIRPDAVRIEKRRVHPFGPAGLDRREAAIGRLPRRVIAKGRPVLAGDLIEPPEISRGDRITVEVSSGSALLQFEGVAESGGRTGDLILIKNAATGKRIRARVMRKGFAVVEAAS